VTEPIVSEHRLLIATDVPFWNRSTGAEQRIAALADFLAKKSVAVCIFFVGELEEPDRQRIAAQGLDVVAGSSHQPPSDPYKKIRWHLQATLFRCRQLIGKSGSPDRSEPLTLDDYRWPWAVDQFAELVNEFRPHSILIEYATLAYLLAGLGPAVRQNIVCLIDTHDVLHARDQQFRDRGYPHWLSISREEEAEALALFDVIVAIQPSEAEVFRNLAPNSKTIVAGHSLEHQAIEICPRKPDQAFVVGYLGSRNFSNLFAINKFVESAIERGLFEDPCPIELHVAGDICLWLNEETGTRFQSTSRIRLLGRVENLNEYYSSLDVVINPVEFGTGLKIKNCEALSYGCRLITTPAGQEGLPAGLERFVFIVETQQEMVAKIRELAHNRDHSGNLRRELLAAAKVLFSDDSAYSELYDVLSSSNPTQIL
jgi:glycosyltransferase involved in cell wall biosynthesis